MEKNTIFAVILSGIFLIVWFMFFQPKPPVAPPTEQPAAGSVSEAQPSNIAAQPTEATKAAPVTFEKEISVETKNYKAIFTTIGGAVKHWYLKEPDGNMLDLVFTGEAPENRAVLPFETFPDLDYTVAEQTDSKIVFTAQSKEGFEIRKTFLVSDTYRNNLSIEVKKLAPAAVLPAISLDWGFGVGSDDKDSNTLKSLEILGLNTQNKQKIKKLKPGEINFTRDFKWIALKNRHFLVALIPPAGAALDTIDLIKQGKKSHAELSISLAKASPKDDSVSYSLDFFLGPKEYDLLKKTGDDLVEAINLGFLGTIALKTLLFFHKSVGNYGWAIILLTMCVQIIVLPLTIKSYRATGAMKELQPQMKALQEKFKGDPKRLNAEMMNLYKTKKVNPLSGCLPMLLQLPIFYALFATLQNAYELRGADWILWVKDLSRPDALFLISGFTFNLLPFIMGIGMFLQQKLMSVSVDPAQANLTYIMPIMFTVMFWGFPSGLVLYWLTNSVLSMLTQYLVMPKNQELVAP
jgi:YidC/Oxa1 family membrane protein insertase